MFQNPAPKSPPDPLCVFVFVFVFVWPGEVWEHRGLRLLWLFLVQLALLGFLHVPVLHEVKCLYGSSFMSMLWLFLVLVVSNPI